MKVSNTKAVLDSQSRGNPELQDKIKGRHEKLWEVSKSFEAVFVNQMVSSMRKTVVKGGLIPESQGEKLYRSWLDYEHSQKIADSEQMGLAQMIYDHLLQIQTGR